jgi:hypothetical protein
MATRNNLHPGRLPQREHEIENMEAYLLKTLGPVKPRQEFVQNLRGRLASKPSQPTEVDHSPPSLLLILGGLVGSILILITSVKATLSLIEALKALRKPKAQSSNTDSSHSASLIRSISLGSR